MNPIRLTVITPVYNGEKYIRACLRNVADQACPGAEHLVVDDGSTDGTAAVVEAFAQGHPGVRLLKLPHQGQPAAMNQGLAAARGPVVGFLNVDDAYEPGTLNRVLEMFPGLPEPALLVGNCHVWGPDGRLRRVNRPRVLTLTEFLVGWDQGAPFPENPSAYFYHKSLHEKAGDYRREEDYAMDLDFLLRAVPLAHCRYVDETWGNFRIVEGSKTFRVQQDGENRSVNERLRAFYRRRLPWPARLRIDAVTRWRYFRKHPSQISAAIAAKFRKSGSSPP